LDADSASVQYHSRLATILQADGKTGDALAEYEVVHRIRPGDKLVLNNMAWIHATSTDARFRDGRKAVELLQPLAARPEFDSNGLDTLAAAYAETGQFDRAVETAESAIAKARGENAPAGAIVDMHKRLALYKKRQPYRERK
jgi:predicted Zn-dependent protease